MAGAQGNITPLKGDEAAGKKHVSSEILKIDPDTLRKIAQQLHDLSIAVQTHRLPIIEARGKAQGEKADFEGEWQPDGKYEEPHSKWQSNAQHYDSRLDEITKQMSEKASALQWIADHFEEAERANAEKMQKVSADIGGTGGAGGHTAPAAPALTAGQKVLEA